MIEVTKSPYFLSPNLSLLNLFLSLEFLIIIVFSPSTASAFVVYIDEPNTIYILNIIKNLIINIVSESNPVPPVPKPEINLKKCFINLKGNTEINVVSLNFGFLNKFTDVLEVECDDFDKEELLVIETDDLSIDSGLVVLNISNIELGSIKSINCSNISVSDVILNVLSDNIVGILIVLRFIDPIVDLTDSIE